MKYCLLLLFFTNCATVGDAFEFKGPHEIRIGKTHKSEVLKRYGEPWRVGYDNGAEQWTYGYYVYRVFGDTDTKDLILTFDKSGRVKTYQYNSSLPEDKKKIIRRSSVR